LGGDSSASPRDPATPCFTSPLLHDDCIAEI
jgi:hypothetical protein